MRGTVKFFNSNPAKNYGFIKTAEAPDDIFFHVSALADKDANPFTGDVVEFDLTELRNGKSRATNVRIVGKRTYE
jgi:cold shock CspA family protein